MILLNEPSLSFLNHIYKQSFHDNYTNLRRVHENRSGKPRVHRGQTRNAVEEIG